MLFRLAALFVIVPALELYLLIRLGTLIGALETFGVILLTGIVGSYLAKSQGLSVWKRFQEKLAAGTLPGAELVDGMIILVSAALLITPGILTDFFGLLGLMPYTRSMIRKAANKRWLPALTIRGVQFAPGSGARTNNGYESTVDPPNADGLSDASTITIGGAAKRRPSGGNAPAA